ncbi:MAG: DUF1499 domain-containing protein [Myxococcales bacterium]|nr:DUF1499 domain-containing protein [Myxococcales bacterium]
MGRIWNLPSFLIAVGVIVGPLATWTGLVDPAIGFQAIFVPAILLAILSAIGFGGAAAVAAALAKPWRRRALIAAVIPLLVTLGALGYASGSPAINDITTDPADPPAFMEGKLLGAAYDSGMAPIQQSAYSDLAPIELAVPPAEAFELALATARGMQGWELSYTDAASATLQARDRTRFFRFVDDVVIRVRAQGSGSRIDLRSRSHLGRGDLGANAARIRAYIEAFESGRSNSVK